MSLPRVLHVNATLSEGGAAGVARTLHDELIALGGHSSYAYGYGPHAGESPLEERYSALRLASKSQVALNRANYALSGRDSSTLSRRTLRELRVLIERADVVHLHVIHSYYLGTKTLFDMLAEVGRPVVWTLHDQWAMTGRCAQPAGCEKWMDGCHPCPNLAAYPSAVIDRTVSVFPERRDLIARLRNLVPTAIVPCAEWLGSAADVGGLGPTHVIKNSVDRAFWEALDTPAPPNSETNPLLRVVFLCRDLRDHGKVDWATLRLVAALPHVELTIVGDNSPVFLPDANYRPANTSRSELAALMQSMNVLLFTSMVDYYPLTVAEGLAAGLKVLAVDSPASREFRDFPQMAIYTGPEDAINQLEGIEAQTGPRNLRNEYFSPSRMTQEYLELYERLMEHQ